MDARLVSGATALVLIFQLMFVGERVVAQYRTPNFVVMAPDPAFAKQVGDEAERFRKELSKLWLGHELPTWPQPCPITVRVERHAGGETSFAFVPDRTGTSHPIDWRMTVYGTPQRILDSVLPHEITHTIFATHYGRPLPRWADEGACSTVEDASERDRSHRMLIEFLSTGRGIPFNHMFAMKQYPSDILPLYSQGYSLARYLIMQRGHRHFVDFVGEGMQREIPGREPHTWNEVSKKYYGFDDLSDLQLTWVKWVKDGCPELDSITDIALAKNNAPSREVRQASVELPVQNKTTAIAADVPNGESWYARQSRTGGNALVQRPGQTGNGEAPSRPDGYTPGSISLELRPNNSNHNDNITRNRADKTIWR